MNPLESCIALSVETSNDIGKLINRAGSNMSVDGYIIAAYRTARLSMREALKSENKARLARDVMAQLRTNIEANSRNVFVDAQIKGIKNAENQLAFFDSRVNGAANSKKLTEQLDNGMVAVISKVDAQTAFINAVVAADQDESFIVGDKDRVGALSPVGVLSASAFWVAALLWNAWEDRVFSNSKNEQYGKMAVATMDNKVTDCCLRVHGQTRDYNESFALTGTPRFADQMPWSPFHWYCRTSISLYSKLHDNGLTDRMIESARTILDERANGIRRERHPADAFIHD